MSPNRGERATPRRSRSSGHLDVRSRRDDRHWDDRGVLAAVRRRRQADRPPEEAPEERRVLVADLVADVVDGARAGLDEPPRPLDPESVDVLDGALPGRGPEAAGERAPSQPGAL